jgi:hypothetical protein
MPFSRVTTLAGGLFVFIVVARVLVGPMLASIHGDEPHWAFAPIDCPAPPEIGARGDLPSVENSIDAFIQHRLAEETLQPSPLAGRATLLRRVTLDLTGLPPTPAELDQYLGDTRPDAYARLVDRLLASPQYGARWARPWLDLCHYADTDGYLTDQPRPVAWRYREWLVDALNHNMPFDQFTIEQIAGDLLPNSRQRQCVATGFLRQTLSNREGGADIEEFRVKQVVDRTQMIGTIWLGLTVGCARCHDHKYDSISQREFFELYACLNDADEVNIDAPLPTEQISFAENRGAYRARRTEVFESHRAEVDQLQRRWEEQLLAAWKNPGRDHVWDRQWELLGLVWGGGLGEGQLEGTEIVKVPIAQRSQRQQDDLVDYFIRSGSVVDEQAFKRLKISDLRESLEKVKDAFPRATRAATMRRTMTPRVAYVHERGEFRDVGEIVRPGTPLCLPESLSEDEAPRLALAKWLVGDKNPLTARVVVNRMWEAFFGRGLVYTTEDFGVRGKSPSHPQLLDWLANEFIQGGWDVKAMHRRIVMSATYRQLSRTTDDRLEQDPSNIFLSRQSPLRVSSDVVRDLGLAVSGLLSRDIGGPSVRPPQPERVTMEAFGNNDWQPSDPPHRYRRGLYTYVIRTAPFAQGITFDAPNPTETCTRRFRSNTPLQALTLLNDPVFHDMAQHFAIRAVLVPGDDGAKFDWCFRQAISRPPDDREMRILVDYLELQRKHFGTQPTLASELLSQVEVPPDQQLETAVWTNVCSVILNLHEFITRD